MYTHSHSVCWHIGWQNLSSRGRCFRGPLKPFNGAQIWGTYACVAEKTIKYHAHVLIDSRNIRVFIANLLLCEIDKFSKQIPLWEPCRVRRWSGETPYPCFPYQPQTTYFYLCLFVLSAATSVVVSSIVDLSAATSVVVSSIVNCQSVISRILRSHTPC